MGSGFSSQENQAPVTDKLQTESRYPEFYVKLQEQLAKIPTFQYNRRSHCVAAMMGVAVGDAAGTRCEFTRTVTEDEQAKCMELAGEGPFHVAPGQFTDDTEMAISLLWAIHFSEKMDFEQIAKWYACWCNLSDAFDTGSTTRNALGIFLTNDRLDLDLADQMFTETNHWNSLFKDKAAATNVTSMSNGCLMRCAPIAIYGHKFVANHSAELAKLSMLDTSITHPNAVAQLATAAYVLIVAHLIQSASRGIDDKVRVDDAVDLAKIWLGTRTTQLDDEGAAAHIILGWFTDALTDSKVEATTHAGYLKHAFVLTIRHLAKQTSYTEAIKNVISHGGDTDTNAAIVGGAVGALHGIGGDNGIPPNLIDKVLACDTTITGQIRPHFLQGKYLPFLAERAGDLGQLYLSQNTAAAAAARSRRDTV